MVRLLSLLFRDISCHKVFQARFNDIDTLLKIFLRNHQRRRETDSILMRRLRNQTSTLHQQTKLPSSPSIRLGLINDNSIKQPFPTNSSNERRINCPDSRTEVFSKFS